METMRRMKVRSGEDYTIYKAWGRRGGCEMNMDTQPEKQRREYQPDAMRLGRKIHPGGLCGFNTRITPFVEVDGGRSHGAMLEDTSGAATWGR
jgi:hypothetical protein